MTHLLVFKVLIGTNLDASVGNRSTVAGSTRQVCNLIAVVSEVVIQRPVPVFRANDLPTDSGLNTHVAQRANVLPSLVAVCGKGFCRSKVEQVLSFTIVPVNATREALVKQTPVNTYIIGSCGLPFQFRSVVIGTIQSTVVCCRIESVLVDVLGIGWNPSVVIVHILLTSLTPAQTELQVGQPLDILQIVLFFHFPHKSERGEYSPVVLETRRTIITHRSGHIVAVHQAPVSTAEERNQIVLCTIPFVSLVVSLTTEALVIIRAGIVTTIVIVGTLPEMLVLVTAHDIEVILSLVVKVVVVLCISTQREVTLKNRLTSMITIVVVGIVRISRRVDRNLLTFSHISTECCVQAKIFESMHLIVDVSTADKLTAVSYIIALVEHGQWVLGGKFIPSVRPCGITIVTSLQPLEVATQVVHRL